MDEFAPLSVPFVTTRRPSGGFGFKGVVMAKKAKTHKARKGSMSRPVKPGSYFKGVGKSAKRFGGKCK